MNATANVSRECRERLEGLVFYAYGENGHGAAEWEDVSRTGASVRLGRYLSPGRELRLRFDSPLEGGESHEIAARVTWCRRVPGSVEFRAGLVVRCFDRSG